MKLQEKSFKNLKYCLWLPENFNAKKKYPVIFFTHGAGSRGNDLNKLEQNHPVLQRILGYAEEAVICAPQCAKDTWFDVFESLIALTEFIHGRAYADKKKFYGIGASMGGYAMIQLMQSRPQLFTAGIICCGGGMYWNAGRLKDIPLRIFHGKQDTVVLPCESEHMSERINECGGNATLTLYPECAHNCWDKVFTNKENFDWLLSHARK